MNRDADLRFVSSFQIRSILQTNALSASTPCCHSQLGSLNSRADFEVFLMVWALWEREAMVQRIITVLCFSLTGRSSHWSRYLSSYYDFVRQFCQAITTVS